MAELWLLLCFVYGPSDVGLPQSIIGMGRAGAAHRPSRSITPPRGAHARSEAAREAANAGRPDAQRHGAPRDVRRQ